MKIKVNDKGILIPKRMLKGVTEVEIRRENGFLLVIPSSKPDPLELLGSEPIVCGVEDASENLDKYIYSR
jgi:hypothetical protein